MSQSHSELELDRDDYEYTEIAQLYDSVSLQRGLGYSGTQILIVEKECEMCGYDRMVQEISVSPEQPDHFTYHCQSPSCPNHHEGDLKGLRILR